jgi:DNA primase
VATAGTALTEYQLKALGRLTPDIRLCFDADRAGIQATERAIPIAAKAEVHLSVIQIPSGKDPDELIKQDVSIWQKIINEPKEALDWLIEQYRITQDLSTNRGRSAFKQAVLGLVARLESKGEQSIYADKAAKALGYPNGDSLRDEINDIGRKDEEKKYKPIKKTTVIAQDEAAQSKNEDNLLALTLMHPKLRFHLYPLAPSMFASEQAREVFEFLAANPDYDGTDKAAVQKFADYAKILSLVHETLYQDVDPSDLDAEAKRLQGKLVAQYVRTEKLKLTERLRTAESTEAEVLLKRAAELDELLRTNEPKEKEGP